MVEGVEVFSFVGADLRQDAVTVGSFGGGVALWVMDRVACDMAGEFLGEGNEFKDSLGSFGADGVWYSVG